MATEALLLDKDEIEQLRERFLRYVQIDTVSDEHRTTVPSTSAQWDLQRLLADELRQLGADAVTVTDNGFVMATIPATVTHTVPTVAFLAHVDTVHHFGGKQVVPRVHQNYDGAPISFPNNGSLELSPDVNSYLGTKLGHDVVTASGDTILGADDKAGVAIIMALAAHLLANPSIPHGEIRLCFTPDEEIGIGIRHIDLALLNADVAYTLDGGAVGRLVYETFSADKAVVQVTGVSAHTGSATGQMVNALHLAAKIIELLPKDQRTPATTAEKEGFIHVYSLNGDASSATLQFFLRDFELDGLQAHGALVERICETVQLTEPRATISCTITPQYRNMRYWLEKDMRPVDKAMAAMRAAGIEPLFEPTRGGTDGSQLTEMGVPTPNLFTGMQNIHSPLEWVSVQDMAQATTVCIYLAQEWSKP
ncbi:MAG TPA: peptidase T [Caldilineaceae bacterium]|nr:peptidase T [Caldilineaceae bacterium]